MSPHHSDQMSQRSQVSRIAHWRCSLNVFVFVIVFVFVFLFAIVFFGQVMSPHHSDQMSQRSQVSRVTLCMSKVKILSYLSTVFTCLIFFDIVLKNRLTRGLGPERSFNIWILFPKKKYSQLQTRNIYHCEMKCSLRLILDMLLWDMSSIEYFQLDVPDF